MTAAYLISKCHLTALGMKTAEKVRSEHPPDIDKLTVFGGVAYAHIRQDKIKPKALRRIFLRYPKGVKSYRMWCIAPCYKRCIKI